jgi:hypothetical protein
VLLPLLNILSAALAVCLIGAAILNATYRGRGDRPRALIVGDGAFKVPRPTAYFLQMAPPAVWLLIYAVFLTHYRLESNIDDTGIFRTSSLIMMTLAAAVSAAVIVITLALWQRPPIAITNSGVQVGRRLVAWADVASDPKLVARHLPINGPDQPLYDKNVDLGADPAFVGAAIGHYLRHPEARAAIGDPAELDRLYEALF